MILILENTGLRKAVQCTNYPALLIAETRMIGFLEACGRKHKIYY